MEVTSGQEPSSKRWLHAHCIIEGCQNGRKKNPKMLFHVVPTKDPPRLKRWLVALNLNLNTPKRNLHGHIVCQKHFVRSDYQSTSRPILNHDAVPSVGINTQPMMDPKIQAVLKAWEETAVRPELSDDEPLMECDEDELTLTLSSEEDEDQTDVATAKQVVRSCIASLPRTPVLSSPPPLAVQPHTPTPSGPVAHSLHNKPSPESVFPIRGRPLKPMGPDRVKPLQKDPTGSSVREESQKMQEQENKELQEDQEIFLFAPIEEEDNEEEEAQEEENLEEEEQEEENEEVQMEESSAAGDAGLHHEEENPPPEWTAPAPKRTRLHSPVRPPHGPQSSASSRSLTGFKLNGSHVSLLPVGGGVELKLISRTGGSACGFTCIKLSPITTSSTPVHTSNSKTTPVHHYNNITPVHTSNSKTTPVHYYNNITTVHISNRSKPFTSSTPPKTDSFPVITGVVCGSAAEVLSRRTLKSSDKAPLMRMTDVATAKQVVRRCIASLPPTPVLSSPPPLAVQPHTPTPSGPVAHSLHNKPSPESVFPIRGRPLKPMGPDRVKPLQKGLRGQVRPPDCTVCQSQYKMVPSLRGFVCLCSIEILQCLRQAQRFEGHFKRKHRSPWSTYSRTDLQTVSETSKTRGPSLLPPPLHHLPPVSPARHQPSLVTPPMPHLSPVSPARQQHPPPSVSSPLSSTSTSSSAGLYPSPSPQQEKVVIQVEDFFYGTDEGLEGLRSKGTQSSDGRYECDHCHTTLQNNIRFMSHMKKHIEARYQEEDRVNHCHHCYRNFKTPFKLQRHLEVHSPNNIAPTCKICELSYENESALLNHMRSTHKPGEMPYICQVCEYRSSFYSSVVRHFREAHVNTAYLLCIHCLRVFRSKAAYQQHTTRHMRKFVYCCVMCRLIFLFGRDLKLHKQCCHKTHIRPRQLDGLKPGTKVTVSSLSAEPVQDDTANCLVPSPEVSHGPGSSQHLNNKEPPVIILDDDSNDATDTNTSQYPTIKESGDRLETQGRERRDMQETMEAGLEPVPSQLATRTCCLECQNAVLSGWSHFVAGVRCSLCTYVTYCSRAYANHMMSNHVIEKTNSNYVSMYRSYPRLPRRLGCQFCTYMTTTGDMMANHLAEHPGHRAMAVNVSEEQRGSNPVNVSEEQRGSNPGGGSFIPIHLLPAGPASPKLSINTLPSPSPLPSHGISAITLTFRSPQDTKDSEKKMSTRSQRPPPLTVSELQMVLYSLCNGVPQAAQCFRGDPALIRAWTRQQAQDTIKDNTHSTWNSDRLAEWVLTQREQQLCVSEDSLMRAATNALKPSSCGLREAYCWAVNFMLSHSLSLQPFATTTDSRGPNRRLPRNLSENAKTFTHFLQKQLQTGLPPGAVGYLDELSVFIDPGRLSSSSSAFSLFSSQADTPPLVDIMLCGLADGTCFSPIIFYTGTSPVLPEGFPTNITLLAAADGFTEQCRLDLWHHKVWRPHVSNHSKSVLIMDSHRGHMDDHFLSTLSSSHTAPVVIPIGCSSHLQPLDVCITPVVREFLQARWSQLLSYGGVEGLSVEQLVVTLCCWLSEVASTLSHHQDILRRSFAMVSATPGKLEPVGANEMIQTLAQALID